MNMNNHNESIHIDRARHGFHCPAMHVSTLNGCHSKWTVDLQASRPLVPVTCLVGLLCVCVCMFVGSLQGPRAHACHDDDDDVCT